MSGLSNAEMRQLPGKVLRIGGFGGIAADILPYGAIIQSLWVPCDNGVRQVLANYASLDAYERDLAYVGCIVGRVANRIRDARLCRGGKTFKLTANEGTTCLHGGGEGLNRRRWAIGHHSSNRLVLSLNSPAGDQGFPGALGVTVTLEVLGLDSLTIQYEARTSEPTPVDLTHHLYFNLGPPDGDIRDHCLKIRGEEVIELDQDFLATGKLLSVRGTPYDLRQGRRLSSVVDGEHAQLTSIGLNQAWVMDAGRPALCLSSPDTKLELELETDQACLQLYSGLDRAIRKGGALAIEPQGFVGAAHLDNFPSIWLEPGQTYSRRTTYRFRQR